MDSQKLALHGPGLPHFSLHIFCRTLYSASKSLPRVTHTLFLACQGSWRKIRARIGVSPCPAVNKISARAWLWWLKKLSEFFQDQAKAKSQVAYQWLVSSTYSMIWSNAGISEMPLWRQSEVTTQSPEMFTFLPRSTMSQHYSTNHCCCMIVVT